MTTPCIGGFTADRLTNLVESTDSQPVGRSRGHCTSPNAAHPSLLVPQSGHHAEVSDSLINSHFPRKVRARALQALRQASHGAGPRDVLVGPRQRKQVSYTQAVRTSLACAVASHRRSPPPLLASSAISPAAFAKRCGTGTASSMGCKRRTDAARPRDDAAVASASPLLLA
eukprot:6212898-Pleurochrysis_carterae.AAC.3